MKNLTLSAVEWCMDLLIHTNGQTTTLEVKNELRNIGYYAEQAEVSKLMRQLSEAKVGEPEIYNIENTGNFNTYSFTSHMTDVVANATDVCTPAMDEEDEDENEYIANDDNIDFSKYVMTDDVMTSTAPVSPASPIISNIMNTIKTSREPQYIFYTEKHARDSKLNINTWMVFDASGSSVEIHAYDENLTRDQVRSRYASLMHLKIQNVRAKRLYNY